MNKLPATGQESISPWMRAEKTISAFIRKFDFVSFRRETSPFSSKTLWTKVLWEMVFELWCLAGGGTISSWDVPVLGLLWALHGLLCSLCFEGNVNNAVTAALIYKVIQENIQNFDVLPLWFPVGVATRKGTDRQIVICKAGRGEKQKVCLPACFQKDSSAWRGTKI